MNLKSIDTPALILDKGIMQANINRMHDKAKALGVTLRPHVKTSKCWEVVRRQLLGKEGPITVSTLKEAEEFALHGVTDMIYAVGIAPQKLPRVAALYEKGVDLKIILDNVASANAVSTFCKTHHYAFKVLIEIDCDGHRSGLRPNDPEIINVAKAIEAPAILSGVITHAGGSYDVDTEEALIKRAHGERDGICAAKNLLSSAGFKCETVSVGSTPTALYADNLEGVTELRAGVYVFFDLYQAGVGSCQLSDIACSLLVTVIGHQKDKGWIITDGGWMAMSRDRGTANQKIDQGYGLVCDIDGKIISGLWMSGANQEHGIISARDNSAIDWEDFPIGKRLRILPNHACPFAAQHPRYYVVDNSQEVLDVWDRFYGW